jgi:hypothetical protein
VLDNEEAKRKMYDGLEDTNAEQQFKAFKKEFNK